MKGRRMKICHSQTERGSLDVVDEASPTTMSLHESQVRSSDTRHPSTGSEVSSTLSRPDSHVTIASRPSLVSSITTTSFAPDLVIESKTSGKSRRRPSLVSRLGVFRSSSSTTRVCSSSLFEPTSIAPTDFRRPSETPEKHFIDSVGMVIPGVCNRAACSHPRSHFVVSWRLCEPIEYTTLLADHGVTYSDYIRLLAALAGFLKDLFYDAEIKQAAKTPKSNSPSLSSGTKCRPSQPSKSPKQSSLEPLRHLQDLEHKVTRLNDLLSDISFHWRARGTPVMVCVSSFSLFAPHRIAESHIQILHVVSPRKHRAIASSGPRLSFVDWPTGLIRTESLKAPSAAANKLGGKMGPISQPSPSPPAHHHQLHRRDRTRPWPLWPNAIPSAKRATVELTAERYGADPYFRAWMRANINSRTMSSSYAKYMIETENNPFINRRLDYVSSPPSISLLDGLLSYSRSSRHTKRSGFSNRDRYEHNRRLECRKTSENGSRLRLVRFAFRHPIYPIYTPEMAELGLEEAVYKNIIASIDGFQKEYEHSNCMPRFCSLRAIHRRSAEEAVAKVSEYIRELNAMRLGRVVWTMEKIPDVYDTYLGRYGAEWEISAWDAEDPLELLLHLEKWGIVENNYGVDDDE